MKKIYLVESCDSDEGQVFLDAVTAETPDEAETKVFALRDDYATHVQTVTLEEHLAGLYRVIEDFKKMTPESVDAEWTDLVKQETN